MTLVQTILMAAGATVAVAGSNGPWELRSGAERAAGLAPWGIRLVSSEAAPDADNTGRNVRDRDESARTPTDQGGSEADRNITAHIRKEIVANDNLSTNAHNVKIITTDGVVTLRGPVKTTQEKAAVAAAAQRAPGVKRVDNQLEIERNE
jgi:hyperosmotically inducible periplasmic protein